MRSVFYILIIGLFFSGVLSCKKIKSNKFVGKYDCTVNYNYFDVSPTYFDTVYTDTIIVTYEKGYLFFNNTQLHIDSLDENNFREEINGSSYVNIRFISDSIYYNYGGGGLGGSSHTKFKGKKI